MSSFDTFHNGGTGPTSSSSGWNEHSYFDQEGSLNSPPITEHFATGGTGSSTSSSSGVGGAKGKNDMTSPPSSSNSIPHSPPSSPGALDDDDSKDGNDDGCGEGKSEKQKTRRTNQNIASRNYRQRKKVYIKEMEDRIHQLMMENDGLKKDLSKIGNNPIELLKFPQELAFLMTNIRKIVIQLDQALRNGESDFVLRTILNSWNTSMDQASALNEKEIEKFVHPYTQVKLTLLGYKPFSNPWTDFVMNSSHINWWPRYTDKAELTLEQNEQITSLWAAYSEEDATLRKEMSDLDEKIKKFYMSKVIILPDCEKLNVLAQSNIPIEDSPEGETAEIGDILEFTFNLERLKQKFIKVSRLMWDTSKKMGKFLSTRQEAILLVLVHSNTKYIHQNMEMANNLWNQLNQSNYRQLATTRANGAGVSPGMAGLKMSMSSSFSPLGSGVSKSIITSSPSPPLHSFDNSNNPLASYQANSNIGMFSPHQSYRLPPQTVQAPQHPQFVLGMHQTPGFPAQQQQFTGPINDQFTPSNTPPGGSSGRFPNANHNNNNNNNHHPVASNNTNATGGNNSEPSYQFHYYNPIQ
ncbi:hypothetical protein SAMD00019534_017250 [Acytostelium subglobosum LB1]|uniref:hypothetical protein n=1 Tax=Acytostelium subglobosum LB1 TaxID=1410327 RepID=UPI000644A8BD|nr:hypothetical protein SAMD00019534_017250 [Acytostelium subglobosum LB1]GAM18550.1 hypothetical protein SAMD00019534_017250 [Acytostelium subglobosum LB1]|eukprot:XP_012757770.1 hypothetical protein SAMD00019534_017250 [Acytostelium subglobosum LB1]